MILWVMVIAEQGTICGTLLPDGTLSYVNRYDIRSQSFDHIHSNIALTPTQLFQQFVQSVNSQVPYNKGGTINAFPIITFHNLTYSNEVYNELPSGKEHPLDSRRHTTYTYILLLLSNNKPLFAEVRVLVHGRSSTLKDVIASQNTENNSNRTRVLQKNSLPSDVPQNTTALNIIFPALKSGNDNNANIASTNSNAYDVIILGHQEYVTQQEYDYLKNFVSMVAL
jgi:hypothetical protein